jgi:predicted nucleic acid-binding protein
VILIDTGPLVALCDARDQFHQRAIDDLRELGASARNTFATCEAVIAEACFHLPYESQRMRLRLLLDELGVAVVPTATSGGEVDDIFEWLVKYAEHEPDWADGSIAVLAGRDEGIRVWTYDTEFRTTWRRPNGTRIPLTARRRSGP